MTTERLDKLISVSGLASRREAKELVRLGRVTVDGRTAKSVEEKYDSGSVEICIDGVPINCAKFRYFMLHKPAGVLTAVEDARQRTVLDLFPPELQKLGIVPAGRLDKDTTGLLILTNDGDMVHRIISPKKQVEKLYLAEVESEPAPQSELKFEKGIVLGDGTHCLPARLERLGNKKVLVYVHEGKYHQVKRMLASCGAPVLQLHRLRIGALTLPENLAAGEWLELDAKEIQKALE